MTKPDRKWWTDHDEVVAFARWYWEGTFNVFGTVGTVGEILDYFEKPWKFNEEYEGYKEDTNGEREGATHDEA